MDELFATVESLFVRLQLPTPDKGSLAYRHAEGALEDATDTMRDIIGQSLTADTTTLTETVPVGGVINMPVVPVTALRSVTLARTGAKVSARLENSKQVMVWGADGMRVRIECDYGWEQIPPVIAKWTRVLAAASMAAAKTGNLGLSGGIAGVGIDDARVSFATRRGEQGEGMDIPEKIQMRLRATYGALPTTAEHRP